MIKHIRVIVGALLCLATLSAAAQTAEQLQQENARLRAQLAAQQTASAQIPNGTARLDATIQSIRAGQPAGFTNSHAGLTITMILRNTGSVPLALNYQQKTFSATDNNGYQYSLYHEHLVTAYSEDIKGIPMASSSRASTNFVLQPGQSSPVTFIAVRYLDKGQTVGNRVDVTATFGAYQDMGQGRIKQLQTFPVSLLGQPIATGAGWGQAANAAGNVIDSTADRVLNKIFK